MEHLQLKSALAQKLIVQPYIRPAETLTSSCFLSNYKESEKEKKNPTVTCLCSKITMCYSGCNFPEYVCDMSCEILQPLHSLDKQSQNWSAWGWQRVQEELKKEKFKDEEQWQVFCMDKNPPGRLDLTEFLWKILDTVGHCSDFSC